MRVVVQRVTQASVTVADTVTGSIDRAAEALATAGISGMRMEVARATSGAVIVNDAYNANPTSMRAALDALAAMDADRRIAVLGVMAELDDPPAAHRHVMNDALERGIEVIAVGTDLYGIRPVDDPVRALGDVGPRDVVLVKASRAGGLERWVQPLLEGWRDPGCD